MLVFRAGIYKMLAILANRQFPDKQFDLGLHCLSRLFGQTTSVPNFRTFTVLFDFSLTVKAAPHECVIRSSQH